jgi:hypothetical protein
MAMDCDAKKKWVDALRSGKYAQGRNALRKRNRYCCLGVLCDLTDGDQWVEDEKSSIYWYHFGGNRSRVLLPFALADEYDIFSCDIGLLARMNDDGKSFVQIADYIESHL